MKQVTRSYVVLLESAGPGGRCMASVVGLPVFAVAKDHKSALRQVRKALEQHLAVLREHGERIPPAPRIVELQVAV